MRYAISRTTATPIPPSRGGLGAARLDTNSPFVEWFDRKQHAAWCAMYPHLLDVIAAGRRAAQTAERLRQLAITPAVSMVLPDLALDLQAKAAEQTAWARRARDLADYIYAVKDYVLGAEFGKEGWAYESWCRQHGYAMKSREQLLREAQGTPRAGLGIPPLVLVGAGVTLAFIIYQIGLTIREVTAGTRYQEAIDAAAQACARGETAGCRRAQQLTNALAEEKRNLSKKDDAFGSIATAVKWTALAALGFFALSAFTKSKYATKQAPTPEGAGA